MIRNSVAADILAQIQACLPDTCSYKLFRSRGLPPADCNTIAFAWSDRHPESEQGCRGMTPCDRVVDQRFTLVLTKCCDGIDGHDFFPTQLEDDETVCFENDLQLLEECIECGDWSQLGLDHGINSIELESTRRDNETEGGCMTAYLTVLIVANECC